MNRSWAELSKMFLERRVQCDNFSDALTSMGGLCAWLDRRRWQLYGFSSMHELTVFQTKPTYPLHHSVQRLVIQPTAAESVKFEFHQNNSYSGTYIRVVPHEEAILQMCKFLKQTKWVQDIPFPT